MILCVSFSGLLGAIHEAPWLQKKAYFNSNADIIISAILSFVYWVAAQWSTWVIAFQFYSTAEQMKKVDKHFKAKYDKRRGMTDEQIKVEKQKKFLQRQKERLFGMVDHLDYIKQVGTLAVQQVSSQPQVRSQPSISVQDIDHDQDPLPVPAAAQEGEPDVTGNIRMYRKRLMRWKNIGVWLVFLSVGVSTYASARLTEHAERGHDPRTNRDMQKMLTIGYIFGGLNMFVQLAACLIMCVATQKMQKLANKNNFDKN